MKKKVVFLDRDGTLIEEVNFLHRVEDLRFFSYTDEAVRLLKDNGFLVVLVTNQSGIGRGYYSEDEMNAVHEKIQSELTEKLDAIYHCPHVPDAGCSCRKPNLGMIERACAEFAVELDLENSWVVGDKRLDVELGQNAGIQSVLVMTGYGREHVGRIESQPSLIAKNLLEAAEHIVSSSASREPVTAH